MLGKTIVVDKGVLGISGQPHRNNFNDFASYHLKKYFGATVASRFYQYKSLSFSFIEPNGDNPVPNQTTTINGFTDENAFMAFFNGKYSNGTNYTQEVEMTVFMSIDEKMVAPTIYAKNSKLGQFKGRRQYRKGKTIEDAYTSSWDDVSIIPHMRRFWLDTFSEDLTDAFLLNNPSIKPIFWMKKDCDRLGVCPPNTRVSGNDSNWGLYCVEDSNPATDTLSMSHMGIAQGFGIKAYASSVTSPRYYVLDSNTDSLNIYGNDALDWGTRVTGGNRVLSGDYSVVSVHGIQISADLGGGVKTYRALKVDPVGVDTIYFDYIKPSRYKVYSVTKTRNGNMKLKEISYSLNGNGQRLGRIRTSGWLSNDFTDSANEGMATGTEDTHLVYQDIITGKFSELSESKMRMVRDLRFRVPFFTLVS